MSIASAIIVAAGAGTRMRSATPKPYISVAGHPLLYHTLQPFLHCSRISQIILVLAAQQFGKADLNLIIPPAAKDRITVVPGGKRRQDSVWNGLQAVAQDTATVVVHDGARPLLRRNHLKQLLDHCNARSGAILAIPAVDTLKEVDQNQVVKTLDRWKIWQVQTPQAFPKSVLIKAFRQAEQEHFTGTDEASLVERLAFPVTVIRGDKYNIKVTVPEDLELVRSILERNKRS